MNATIERISDEKKAAGGDILPLRVCFVCSGNTCRSPMAAAITNDLGRSSLLHPLGIKATSAGISAFDGMPISKNAEIALSDSGIKSLPDNNYEGHVSRSISLSDMELSDMIIGISGRHTMALISAFPQYASKIFSMDKDIPDPFGGDIEDYKVCLERIRGCVERMFFEK